MCCKFFRIFIGSYIKIHKQWGFQVNYYEVRGLFLKKYELQTYFPKRFGVRINIHGPRA
jgi:hypothetical protein